MGGAGLETNWFILELSTQSINLTKKPVPYPNESSANPRRSITRDPLGPIGLAMPTLRIDMTCITHVRGIE